MATFTLNITLGNEAMQTGVDVAYALPEIQNDLGLGRTSGKVYDDNGNRVGEWGIA